MEDIQKSNLKVWYGFDKITGVRRQRALRIRFENTSGRYERKMKHVLRMGKTVERYQSIEEAESGQGAGREFTDWVIFIDKKPFFGDIEAVLQHNYNEDINHCSPDELERIRSELRNIFKSAYPNFSQKKQFNQ